MLTKWIIGNFKSVAEETTLELKPVTILAGANSSGKSTVLQSILLIAQTLKAAPGPSALILNGEYTRLGYLSDILHNQNTRLPFVFGFELSAHNKQNKQPDGSEKHQLFPISLRTELGMEDIQFEDAPHYGKLKHVSIDWNGHEATEIVALDDRYTHIINQYQQMQMRRELRESLGSGKYQFEIRRSTQYYRHIASYNPLVRMNYFLPNTILETFDATHHYATIKLLEISDLLKKTRIDSSPGSKDRILLNELNLNKPDNLFLRRYIRAELGKLKGKRGITRSQQTEIVKADRKVADSPKLGDGIRFVMRDIPTGAREIIARHLRQSADGIDLRQQNIPPKEIGVRVGRLPEDLYRVTKEITRFFGTQIYYLGPLRVEPQFVYHLPPYPELTHVGLKGEFTAPVLEHFRGSLVDFPLPPTHPKAKKGKLVDNGPLIHALKLWLEYMGLVEEVKTKDRGKMGTELTVRSEGVDRELDLTSIGVGVSQVLPTLVMGLIAPQGTTFLLEQPELHLHPRIQSRLADFLLGLTRVGKQCIVETHSEYLINRLRRRVAEDETDSLSKDIQIYFVEREAGKTQFRNVNMNDYGAILKWPKGFFDEGPREADLIMQAAMKKRRERMTKQVRPGSKHDAPHT